MSCIRLNAGAPDSPQMVGLDDAAWALWLRGVCHASRHKTNGQIDKSIIGRLTSNTKPCRVAQDLVDAGLWISTPNGWEIVTDMSICRASRPEWSRAAYPAAFARDGYKCRYCGADCTIDPTIDHVRPRVQGGGDGLANLVVCCRPCNLRKSGRTPEQAGMVLR